MSALLAVDGLSRRFGGLLAVDQVSFSVAEGQIAAVIGPNGAGKTTLFNLITGFLAADRGVVHLAGENVTALAPHKIAARGLIRTFQLVRLFKDMSVLENVLAGCHVRGRGGILSAIAPPAWARRQERDFHETACATLELVGLADQITTSAANLTYGQQRLLELARALVAAPRLLMLDEPAAGLTPAETEALSRLVKLVRDRGVTILLIEHDMDMVMNLAEKIVVLDFGRKIAEGTPADIQGDPGVREAYLGLNE